MNMMELQDSDNPDSDHPRVGQSAFDTFEDLIDFPEDIDIFEMDEELT